MVDGKHDLRALTTMLQQPLLADFRKPSKSVWHCALRTAPADRRLSDAEWEVVVREVLDRTGLASKDDEGGCRWVAVRHAADHVHVVVTLARQDGRRVSTSNDFYRVGEACRSMEAQLGLQLTGATDRTAGKQASRGEVEKALRHERTEAPRVLLRRAVLSAAAVANSPAAFVTELRAAGVLVRERRSEQDPDVITGYAVAWPGDHNAEGQPVWFGGSKLAPDLSWGRLAARWETPSGPLPPQLTTDPALRQDAYRQATQTVRAAARALGDHQRITEADDVATAGGDVIAAAGRLVEGRQEGTVHRVTDRYQRAARASWGRVPPASPLGAYLRRAARDLARLARAKRGEGQEVADLLMATGALAAALADLRATQHRREQEAAAREAATALRGAAHLLHRAAPAPSAGTATAHPTVTAAPRQGRGHA
ncbi:relaxase [Streptomyces sp. NP160]|uniref:relaxase/mobilization nuclease domain-containing protein n=1 Tax=Streptomyces sp. NP160 TaxID=2586637 RepID=UPI001117F0EC|nr:relaxase [Streptomyces sp. NP160]TNM66895.1 relaxase [Streptomyces sp. NP160]